MDIEGIHDFIASEDRSAADRVLERIISVVGLLSDRPFLGPEFHETGLPDLRKMSVPPYIVFYRAYQNELQVIRVLHGARHLSDPALFPRK
jgi:toxin ParE1/3/4